MINLEAKNWNNFYLGLVVAILPFIGIPASIKTVLFLVLGILIALFSLARLGRQSGQLPTPASPLNSSNNPTNSDKSVDEATV